jgi:peroxiredoxin (alkyl hydroperoxide reductase subunit C)
VELKVLLTLADTNRNLSNILGILDIESTEYSEETDSVMVEGSNVTYRATYLIDETGKIHESVNDMPLGRNVNEYLRMVDTHIQEKEKFVQQTGSQEKKR